MRTSLVTLAALTAALGTAAPAAAISGSAAGVDASAAQYVSPSSSAVPLGEETAPQGSEPRAIPLGEEVPGQGSAPAAQEIPEATASQPLQSEDTLPFTGYLVISILIAGAGALLVGLVLRRLTTPHRALT